MTETPTGEVASRGIPLPVKREIRQRCGFGCVICGMPLYEYHHIEGWATTKKHVASEITLLCDQHHRETTSELLPKERIIQADSNPHNMEKKASAKHPLHFSGNQCEVRIGGNLFKTRWEKGLGGMVPIMIDGVPIIGFTFEDGNLLLTCHIFDKNNNLILHIEQNQLIYSVSPWDIQFVGKTLTIRERAREILISITFEPPGAVIIDRARILYAGVEVLIEPDGLLITNNNTLLQGNSYLNNGVGLLLGTNPRGVRGIGMAITGLSRYLGDASASQEWAKSMKKKFEK